MIRQVEYFDNPGGDNTSRCLEIVAGLVDEGLSHLVVATTTGKTGVLFAKKFEGKDLNVVAVTHNVGYAGPNQDECSAEVRQELIRLGVKIFTGAILTRGIEASFMKKHQGVYPAYIVAQTLRLLGQGVKVCVEIVVEACDAGFIPEGEDIIAVAGTGKGADTVTIVRARPTDRFLDLRVKQILAKPL